MKVRKHTRTQNGKQVQVREHSRQDIKNMGAKPLGALAAALSLPIAWATSSGFRLGAVLLVSAAALAGIGYLAFANHADKVARKAVAVKIVQARSARLSKPQSVVLTAGNKLARMTYCPDGQGFVNAGGSVACQVGGGSNTLVCEGMNTTAEVVAAPIKIRNNSLSCPGYKTSGL